MSLICIFFFQIADNKGYQIFLLAHSIKKKNTILYFLVISTELRFRYEFDLKLIFLFILQTTKIYYYDLTHSS